jgi:hypothetical protein
VCELATTGQQRLLGRPQQSAAMGGSQSNGSKLKPLAAASAADSEFKPSLVKAKKKRSGQREPGGHKGPVPHNHFLLSDQVEFQDVRQLPLFSLNNQYQISSNIHNCFP